MRPEWPTRAQDRIEAWLERRVAQRADVAFGATLADRRGLRDAARRATRTGSPTASSPSWRAGRREPRADDGLADARAHRHAERLHAGPRPAPAARRPARVQRRPRPRRAARAAAAGRPPERRRPAPDRRGRPRRRRRAPSGCSTRDESLRIQRGADALLLLTGHNRSEATGKLFEYLASGRPIIALAEGNEAARIVRETGTGVAVGGGDPAGAARGAAQRSPTARSSAPTRRAGSSASATRVPPRPSQS